MDESIDDFFRRLSEKNANGTLTIGDLGLFGFYRLLEGEHAGKVVIHNAARIDDKPVLFFANAMTWIEREKLKPVRCERCYPTFNTPMHEVDRSNATWYTDSGKERWYEW